MKSGELPAATELPHSCFGGNAFHHKKYRDRYEIMVTLAYSLYVDVIEAGQLIFPLPLYPRLVSLLVQH